MPSLQVIAKQLSEALRTVLGNQHSPIPLFNPVFTTDDEESVLDVMKSGWVSTLGSATEVFENAIGNAVGCEYVVATNSGTSALHLALIASGVQAGDEVLIPSFSFVATANAVVYCGAFPHFLDVSKSTLGIDPEKLSNYLDEYTGCNNKGKRVNNETGNVISALVVVYPYGYAPDLDSIQIVCEAYGITLVEDAAGALGTKFNQKPIGSWGRFATISFNGNKIITTGAGGAVLCNHPADYKQINYLASVAKSAIPYHHTALGYNYKMAALNAALGISQIERLKNNIKIRKSRFDILQTLISSNKDATLHIPVAESDPNYWLPIVMLSPTIEADKLIAELRLVGVSAARVWQPLNLQDHLKHCYSGPTPNSHAISSSSVFLPALV